MVGEVVVDLIGVVALTGVVGEVDKWLVDVDFDTPL